MVDDDEPVEETVMLTRRGHRSRRADAGAPIDSAAVAAATSSETPEDTVDDRTIAVHREAAVDDRTVVVHREDAVDDRTVAVHRGDAVDDRTVAVDRTRDAAPPTGGSADIEYLEDLDATIPAVPAVRVEAESLPAIYKPRPAPLKPSRPPAVEGGIAPTRVTDEESVSVSRAARRTSAWVLAAVAGACAVSVGGLVTLAFVVFA